MSIWGFMLIYRIIELFLIVFDSLAIFKDYLDLDLAEFGWFFILNLKVFFQYLSFTIAIIQEFMIFVIIMKVIETS